MKPVLEIHSEIIGEEKGTLFRELGVLPYRWVVWPEIKETQKRTFETRYGRFEIEIKIKKTK